MAKSYVNIPLDEALAAVPKKEVAVVAADASDLATAITLVNELKAKLDSMNAGLPA